MYHGDRGDADGLEAVGAPGGMGPDGREMLERRFWRRPFSEGRRTVGEGWSAGNVFILLPFGRIGQ